MSTAKDLAKELEISVSTVGRALANDPRISAATRQRVMEAALRSGYVASRAAQMMRGASSRLVGLILPDLGNSQYSIGAHALAKCLEAEGFQLVLSESGDDPMTELRHLRELCSAGVAGIVIIPSPKPLPESARLLKQRHMCNSFAGTRHLESSGSASITLGHCRTRPSIWSNLVTSESRTLGRRPL